MGFVFLMRKQDCHGLRSFFVIDMCVSDSIVVIGNSRSLIIDDISRGVVGRVGVVVVIVVLVVGVVVVVVVVIVVGSTSCSRSCCNSNRRSSGSNSSGSE